MDLRTPLLDWALARPHVLVFDVPGTTRLRWRVEAELDRRCWRAAGSPADADLLVVVGHPGPALAPAAQLLFDQMPSPKSRLDLADADSIPARLSAAAGGLRDPEMHGAEPSSSDPWGRTGRAAEDQDHEEHEGHEEHGEHEHMHHGGEVAGLAMADTGPDRDGLELDSLRVSLGPWLPGWPTGLVVRGSLQGDVLTEVSAHWLAPGHRPDPEPSELPRDAVALDVLARFLSVAGWPAAATQARAARTAALAGAEDAGRRSVRLADRVRRSRTLAWSVRGLGGDHHGDVLHRVYRWCETAAAPDLEPPPPVAVDEVAASLEGAELAAARLIVAAAAPLPVTTPLATGAGHG